MPITKPSGAISTTVIAIFSGNGSQTSAESSEETTIASSAASSATSPGL